jgi:hypothetical protein
MLTAAPCAFSQSADRFSFALLPRLREHILLGGIVVLAVWYLALAGVLCARNGWPAPAAA